MKITTLILVLLLGMMQYHLWTGNGSLPEVHRLEDKIEQVKQENETLKERNLSLTAEVLDLKQGHEAIEERARSEMGMIKHGETFYQLVDDTGYSQSTN